MTGTPPNDITRFDLRAYERLAGLFPRLLAEDSPESLLEAIADAVEDLIPCSAVLVYGLRDIDGALVPLISRGAVGQVWEAGFASAGDSVEAIAIASARPIRVQTPSESLSTEAGALGEEATAAAPLVVRGLPVGCLTVRRRGAGEIFGNDELHFLARVAEVAAITLDNARARAALADLAQTDSLTGLLNRRGFFVAFERALAQVSRGGGETSVLTLDVDDLKSINDTFGHAVGDDVLLCIAETLKGRARRGDIVGRLGGDEFAIVLPHADTRAALAIQAALHGSLRATRIATPAAAIVPSASFGVAATVGETMTAQQLVAESDLDMYKRKRRRKSARASRLPVA